MNSIALKAPSEAMAAAPARVRLGVLVASVTMFALAAALHFLALVRFSNDEYINLAGAQQMLFGEWPTRDFLDPGLPLAYAASAAAQLIFGRTLFAEAMLTSVAFGLAAALTVVVARRLSGSLLIGIIAALIEVAIFPRGYSYPKMLLYAVAPLIIWWCMKRPSLWRMTALAAFVQVAFLFRHDHGLFIGAGAAVGVALAGDGTRSTRVMLRQLATFVAIGVAVSLPFLIYVGINGGVVRYFVRGVRFSAAEAAENGLVLPPFGGTETLARNSEAFLFFLFYALPLVAAAVLALRWQRSGDRTLAAIAPLIVIALMANGGFLRHELTTRLADAIVPAVLLSAWLVGQLRTVSSKRARTMWAAATAVLFLVSSFTVVTVGRTMEQLNRASLFGGLRRMPERFAERSADLHDRWNERAMPAGPSRVLIPFFQYVDRCTSPEQRLLVPGFIPEVPVHAARPFAGGRMTILPGYLDAPDEGRELVETIKRQDVPFMIVTSRSKSDVWNAYPELATYIDTQFVPLVSYHIGEDQSVLLDVRVNRSIPPTGVDAQTGWPCFR
jgi:hypothetical protein